MKPLHKFYNHSCAYSLFDEIKRFLRPKDFNGPINHNWGDWYCLEDATMIIVYGFEDTPFILPKIVHERITYLDIVR